MNPGHDSRWASATMLLIVAVLVLIAVAVLR